MEKFEINILGCGSALPTMRHNPSSQVVNIREKLYMIDCGEGTQLQFRRSRLPFTRLNHIFISHLHGDHCLGLIGLISTMGLLKRTATLHIYAEPMLETIMRPQLNFFCNGIDFAVEFHPLQPSVAQVVFEDRSVEVSTIPLSHRMPSCGFLFREKPTLRHLLRDWADFYHVPMSCYARIKNGEDYVMPDGTVVPNEKLTSTPAPVRSYAYCSDTRYLDTLPSQLDHVGLLYHEATFMDSEIQRARDTFHSTARQAATIARKANVGQLLIGHYSSRYEDHQQLLEEACEVFPNTLLAYENQKIVL